MGCLKCIIKWGIIIAIVAVCVQYWLANKSYVIDEKVIHEIGSKYAVSGPAGATNVEAMIKKIITELRVKYPHHVLPIEKSDIVLMKSAGFIAQNKIIYMSMSESLCIVGAGLATTGHTGRHASEFSQTVLTGNVKTWKEGQYKTITYKAGDNMKLKSGEAAALMFDEGTWVLEYSRGFTPFLMPYALGDSLFSTLDICGVFKMIRMSFRSMSFECCHCFTHLIEFVKSKLS